MLQKGQGHAGETSCSSEEVLYKIDIPANRYDMLCLEGIARALNIFRGRIPNVQYTLGLPPGMMHPSELLHQKCEILAEDHYIVAIVAMTRLGN